MNKFLFRISTFIVGFITLVILPIIFISQYDNLDAITSENHNIISLQNKSKYDGLDVLFVGNSYCYSAINTKYLDSLNIPSYNLGIATAGVDFYDLIINDYFENISSPPKKVMILLSPMTFSSKSDNFSSYPIHRYLENEVSNLEIAFRFNRFNELFSLYRKSLEKIFTNISNRNDKNQDSVRLNNKGYYASNDVVNKKTISNDEHLYLPLMKNTFGKVKVDKLLDIANEIKRKNSEVIFFELPTNILDKYFNEKYLFDYKNSLVQIAESFELISLDKSMFSEKNYRNIDHMNSSGAYIATREIVKLLHR